MRTVTALLLMGACAVLAPSASAQSKTPTGKYYVTVKGNMALTSSSTLETTLTFSAPVQLPKIKLAAGTYLFTLVSPNTMRVSNADGTKVITTFSTVPTTRTRDLKHAQIRLESMPGGAPPKLIGLYTEGSNQGYQPVFPSGAKQANAPVATSGTVK
jgi:hypothetical protein